MPLTKLATKSSLLNSRLLIPSVPLADKNWFRTGGPAQLFSEPTTAHQLQAVVSYAQTTETPLLMIGEGANMLVSDEGFEGLVVKPQLTSIKRYPFNATHDLVEAQAGVRFPDLIIWCLENNLIGLEEFSGIPGTVGGSVFINIHYFEFLLSQFIISGQVVHKTTGELLTVDADWFQFGYNYSRLHTGEHYLASATFKLKRVDTATAMHAKGRSEEMIRHRAKRYPASHTCGSFFRNFYENEVTLTSHGKKLIYVAYYLDKIGVKGELSVGDAIVSYQHANMIVNRGKAKTADIVALARKMQELVFENFGILPQPECRLVGFKKHPLL